MNPLISIRRAAESDAVELLALRCLIFAETDFMLWEADELRETPTDEVARIKRLNEGRNSTLLVAQDQSRLLGFLAAFGGAANRHRHATSLALGVRRSHWSQGVATALIQSAVDWADGSGIVRIDLTVHCTNQRAIALYERLGFTIEGIRRKSLLVNSQFVDEYLMARLQAT